MLGAIAGDIIGSVYESRPIKTKRFPLFSKDCGFTDDTVLTVAVADAILNKKDFASALKQWGRRYPNAGYGGGFYRWMTSPVSMPYNSWGNGAAMRVSPVGFAFQSSDDVLAQAELSAAVTHNHPQGIKGAQVTALAIYLARIGKSKRDIKNEIEQRFDYDLSGDLDNIRKDYRFDVSCQGSVPQSLIAFLQSRDFEDAIRNAVSLGGDSDTMACIAGGIAQAYYKAIPAFVIREVTTRLPAEFTLVIESFNKQYGITPNRFSSPNESSV